MKLGNLKTIDLRNVWNHEAHDFTRWLADEENIAILSEELDIEMENIKAEESAGRYSVDIIADEVNSGKKIIIENQLETTDHKHLGQILTYASAHDAGIIIWIVFLGLFRWLSLDKLPFIPGQIIKRSSIHDQFGGNAQSGISPSARFPYIFIFSFFSEKGLNFPPMQNS